MPSADSPRLSHWLRCLTACCQRRWHQRAPFSLRLQLRRDGCPQRRPSFPLAEKPAAPTASKKLRGQAIANIDREERGKGGGTDPGRAGWLPAAAGLPMSTTDLQPAARSAAGCAADPPASCESPAAAPAATCEAQHQASRDAACPASRSAPVQHPASHAAACAASRSAPMMLMLPECC